VIDRELVTRKLVLISTELGPLERLAALSLDAFLADPTHAVLAERYVERAVGRMIDVNYHLLTESGHPPPPDYYQSFLALAGLGACPAGFARRIAGAAGLRNRIAHEYDEIDPQRLHAALSDAIRDIPEYIRLVDAWVSGRD